jgi:hypothetical protein
LIEINRELDASYKSACNPFRDSSPGKIQDSYLGGFLPVHFSIAITGYLLDKLLSKDFFVVYLFLLAFVNSKAQVADSISYRIEHDSLESL